MKSHENCSRKELEAYIGIEAQKPFFSKALDIYTKNPNTPIWNFAAFFLNIFWFMYRKSLILSLLVCIVLLVLSTSLPIYISSVLLILIYVLMGLFGTNLYLHFAEKEINKLRDFNYMTDENEFLKKISSRGGTSFVQPTILYLILVIFLGILLFN